METTAPIIPQPPGRLWTPADADNSHDPVVETAARRLGLKLSVVVALACDAIAMGMAGSTPSPIALLWGIIPVTAAAPFGWLLGPTVARSRTPGAIGAALLLGIGTMLAGDVLVSALSVLWAVTTPGIGVGEVLGMFATLIIMGALFVGPFVLAIATLPAGLVWVVAFNVAWRRHLETGGSAG